jgi:hypothetical protein
MNACNRAFRGGATAYSSCRSIGVRSKDSDTTATPALSSPLHERLAHLSLPPARELLISREAREVITLVVAAMKAQAHRLSGATDPHE